MKKNNRLTEQPNYGVKLLTTNPLAGEIKVRAFTAESIMSNVSAENDENENLQISPLSGLVQQRAYTTTL